MVDLDAARLQSVGNIGGTGYYYTNVICVFAMANFVLQLGGDSFKKNGIFWEFFPKRGGGSPHFPKLLYNYQVIFDMPNSS